MFWLAIRSRTHVGVNCIIRPLVTLICTQLKLAKLDNLESRRRYTPLPCLHVMKRAAARRYRPERRHMCTPRAAPASRHAGISKAKAPSMRSNLCARGVAVVPIPLPKWRGHRYRVPTPGLMHPSRPHAPHTAATAYLAALSVRSPFNDHRCISGFVTRGDAVHESLTARPPFHAVHIKRPVKTKEKEKNIKRPVQHEHWQWPVRGRRGALQ